MMLVPVEEFEHAAFTANTFRNLKKFQNIQFS